MSTYKNLIRTKRSEKINESYLYNLDGDKLSTPNGIIPSNFPIGLYTNSRGVKYFIQFSTQDTGYNPSTMGTAYLESNTGYINAYKSGKDYLLSSGNWTHGLNHNNTIINVGKFIDNIPAEVRRDPFLTCRYICAYIPKCYSRHNALLSGVWGGNCRGKTFGSSLPQIFNNYANNRVTYGQCFIFSGLLCGVMRHVGIPCRQIVCTNAGHNAHRTQQITLVDQDFGDGKQDNMSLNWNFHCWTEVYIRTTDVPSGEYCILDGTPQEKSNAEPLKGKYVCGPCPVRALKDANSLNQESKYLDIKYCSTGTRGPLSSGVELYNRSMRRALHIYYYRDISGVGTGIYMQNSNCTGFVDTKSRYKCNTPFPQSNYNITISQNGLSKRVNIAGDTTGLDFYLVLLRTSRRWINSHPPTSEINYYKVKPLTNYMYNENDLRSFTHAYIVVGHQEYSPYMGVDRLVRYDSKQIK